MWTHTFLSWYMHWSLKGNSTGKMNFTLYVRIWAGEWHCESLSCLFSFVSEKIDEETSRTREDDEMGSQVAWPSPRRTGPDVRFFESWPVYAIDQLATRVASWCASASCCAFAHAQSCPTVRWSRALRSHFVIRASHAECHRGCFQTRVHKHLTP